MIKLQLRKFAGAGVLSLGLVLGMAGFAGAESGNIRTTGPNSRNEIRSDSRTDLNLRNTNNIGLTNRTEQRATTGNAEVRHNTIGGSAMTGSASNDNAVDALVELDNSQAAAGLQGLVGGGGQGSSSASIELTGPDSHNSISSEHRTNVDVNNHNDVNIHNTVDQSAHSGNAEVYGNTEGGDAVTGDATNTSSSYFTVSVTN